MAEAAHSDGIPLSKNCEGLPTTISRREMLSALSAPLLLASAQNSPDLSIATFRVDVTCPIDHPLLARRQGIAREVADPLYAHGLVLHGSDDPIAIVAVDWCEIRNDAYDRWRVLLAEAAETSTDRILLCSVHQHDAPLADLGAERLLTEVGMAGETLDTEFFEQTGRRIAAALRESSNGSRRVSHLGLGRAKVEKIASNRRVVLSDGTVTFRRGSNGAVDRLNREADDGLIDPWLKTISFWDGDTPLAALNSYAVHPMSYYGTGEVSADFVGMARDRRRRDDPSVHQMYLSGCSGDVTAGKYNDASRANRAVLADRLYQAMKDAWQASERVPCKSVGFRSVELDLEFRQDPEYTADAMRRVLQDEQAGRKERVLAAMGLSTLQRLRDGRRIDFPCLDLGAAKILLFPGESFVGYQLLAQQLLPDSFVMSIGYGECWTGYLPTESAFDDGFDGHWVWVAPGAEARIEAALERVLQV